MKPFINIGSTVTECRKGDIWKTAIHCYIKEIGLKSHSTLFVALKNKLADDYYQVQFGYPVQGSTSLYPPIIVNTNY